MSTQRNTLTLSLRPHAEALLENVLREQIGEQHARVAMDAMNDLGWRPPFARVAVPKFGRNEAFYFGCRGDAGHFFVNAWGQSLRYEDTVRLLPFGMGVDGKLVPRADANGRQGLARLIRRGGWTCIAFCDRSVDTRPGSNAAFFFRALLSFDDVLDATREVFPWKSFPFEIVLDEETSDPADLE